MHPFGKYMCTRLYIVETKVKIDSHKKALFLHFHFTFLRQICHFAFSECRHGNWICQVDVPCLRRTLYKGYNCTGYTPLHKKIECPDGFTCVIGKPGDNETGIPDLGNCVPLEPGRIHACLVFVQTAMFPILWCYFFPFLDTV